LQAPHLTVHVLQGFLVVLFRGKFKEQFVVLYFLGQVLPVLNDIVQVRPLLEDVFSFLGSIPEIGLKKYFFKFAQPVQLAIYVKDTPRGFGSVVKGL
jgi:hypothetical protein